MLILMDGRVIGCENQISDGAKKEAKATGTSFRDIANVFRLIITSTPLEPPLIAFRLSQRTNRTTSMSSVTKCSLQKAHLAY